MNLGDMAVTPWDGVRRIDRPVPLRSRVRDQLRDLIIAWTLEPGEHLIESELAERLGVSRGPVREALQALHSEGWVDSRSGRGSYVHDPSESEVDEIFIVRVALESEAARLAAGRTSPDDAHRLRQVCRRGREAVTAGDQAGVVEANSTFHVSVAELSGVGLLIDHIKALNLRVRWLYKPLVAVRGMDSWNEHEEIVEALEAHDAARASALMRAHSERTRRARQSGGQATGAGDSP